MSSKVYIQANIIGWLKDDAILEEATPGLYVCKFCIVAKKYNRQTKQEDLVYLECNIWGKKSEKIRPMLRADKYVSVLGTIDSFKKVIINVSDITLLSHADGFKKKKEEMPPPHPKQDKRDPTAEEMQVLF